MAFHKDAGVSLSPLEHFRRQHVKDLDNLHKRLSDFPNSFQMKEHTSLRQNTLTCVKNHLDAARKADHKTKPERVQTLNLLSFVLSKLKKNSEALDCVNKALKLDSQNIVSLANKAVILWQMQGPLRRREAEEEVTKLELLAETEDFAYLIVKANAELAESYMHFGPCFKQHAIDALNKVIPRGREPEVWYWKLTLAVAYRQRLNLQHVPHISESDKEKSHFQVIEMLTEIIEKSDFPHLKANAFAEIAEVLWCTWEWDKGKFQALCNKAQAGPTSACRKALQQCVTEEPSVLRKAGKIYRYKKDLKRSLKHLQRAEKLQPSSTTYHHLGLTHKAWATDYKTRGKVPTRRGGKTKKKGPSKAIGRSDFEYASENEEGMSLNRCRLAKVVKSPPIESVTRFSRDDKHVTETVRNLKEALRFSDGENTRAEYDLALMYIALGNNDEALKCFQEICQKFSSDVLSSVGPLDAIAAYDQAGLLKQEMAKEEQDEEKKAVLKEEAESSLNSALYTLCQLYSKSAQLQGRFADVLQSPRALLKGINESEKQDKQKNKETARIFQMIRNHRKSLAILEKMAATDPQSKGDAEYQVILIKNLIDMDKFGDAVQVLEILRATQLGAEVRQMLGSEYVHNIYLEAGRHALQLSASNAGIYFKSAFTDAFSVNRRGALRPTVTVTRSRENAGACASTEDERASDPICDVVILHEEEEGEGEEIQEKAEATADILKQICGLRVTRMDDDLPPGSQGAFEILKTVENSHLLVVLVGKDTLSAILQHQVDMTTLMGVPTAILLVNGAHLPDSLQTYQSLPADFPQQLMNITSGQAAIDEKGASAIVALFKFMLSCRDDSEHG